MPCSVKILKMDWLTANVLCLTLEKPPFYSFDIGQAVEVTLDLPRFYGDLAPFTLTSLISDDYLELIIKVYPAHKGITLAISNLREGDKLIIGDPWDSYSNLGPGIFIAGGTGITSFVSFLRQLKGAQNLSETRLFFVNKTEQEIFLSEELRQILGQNYVNVLTRENKENFLSGHVDLDFLRKHIPDIHRSFYICGPGGFSEQIKYQLVTMGADPAQVNIGY